MKRRYVLFTVIAALAASVALCLTGCGKGDRYKAPENISYDGRYITWDKIEDVNHYTVSIDGGDATRCNSSTYAYASTESFEATVTAVYDKKSKSASVTFKPLDPIERLTVSDDGEVSWDAVDGANAYSVSINGKTEVVTDTRIALTEGANRVKVKPIVSGDGSYYSTYSDEIDAYVYDAPQRLKYDGGTLSWTGSSASYAVTVGGVTETVRGNRYDYDSENKDFTVVIRSLGDHTGTYDSKPVTEEFRYLDAVTELFVEDGVVKWNAVDGAAGYRIKIGGVVQKTAVDTAEYDGLASGRSQDVAVMPYNDDGNYFSSWSAAKTVYILDTPTVFWNNDLELDGEANNNLTWNAVNAASGYTARLVKDGGAPEISTFSDVQRAFAHAYAAVGKYTVEIKANAEGGSASYYDSKYSAPITVERLAAPRAVGDGFVVSDRDEQLRGFTVNFVKVDGASGYQLYKDGVALSGKFTTGAALGDGNVADGSNISEQHYTYAVRSMGGVRTVGGSKYVTLACLSDDALSFDITVQATPQNPTMSGFTLAWDGVSGGNGYTVAYAGTRVTAQGESFDLSTLKAGEYSVTVSARGDGGSVLASNPSAPTAIKRLQAPTGIRITSSGNGTLQWNDVSDAASYETYLDLSKTPLAENAYGNMYQFIETDGTTLSMIAVANYYNDRRTLYYMTSEASPTQQFVRLAAPSFPEGALSDSIELLWSAPSNINTAEYTPTYRIFSAPGEQIGSGDVNGTRYNIEHLEGGSSYTFYVKAVGDGTKYLDSELSAVITAYKTAAPRLTLDGDKYTWSNVAGASAYYLEIDGKKASDEYHVSGNTYSYAPRFTTEGEHTVKLKALGDGRGNLDSAFFTYIQRARILDKPVIEYRYSSECFVPNGQITVSVTVPSEDCSGYRYEIAGQSVTVSSTEFSKTIQSPGKYTVRVKAVGGCFDDSGVYCIDSLYAGGASSDAITLLPAPSVSSVVITSDGAVKWDAVSGALDYEYRIAFDGGEYGEIATVDFNTLSIENYKRYSSIRVEIRARGDGEKTISSEWCEKLFAR